MSEEIGGGDHLWASPDGNMMSDADITALKLVPSDFAEPMQDGVPLSYGNPGSVSNAKVMPYAPTCNVSSRPKAGVDLGYPGTGFLWGAGVMITAAHNVYDSSSKKWFAELEIGPGRNGNDWPYGRLKVPLVNGTVVVLKSWVNSVNAGKPDRNVDFALVVLKNAMPKPLPGMYAIASRSGGIQGLNFLVPGYTNAAGGVGFMSQGKGLAGARLQSALVYHAAPAGPGASGAPLIICDPKGNPGNVVYAMHVGEDPDVKKNVALEFTDFIRKTIITWAGNARLEGDWLVDPPLD